MATSSKTGAHIAMVMITTKTIIGFVAKTVAFVAPYTFIMAACTLVVVFQATVVTTCII